METVTQEKKFIYIMGDIVATPLNALLLTSEIDNECILHRILPLQIMPMFCPMPFTLYPPVFNYSDVIMLCCVVSCRVMSCRVVSCHVSPTACLWSCFFNPCCYFDTDKSRPWSMLKSQYLN